MKARTLYEKGELGAAIDVLGRELRDDPGDVRRRTFLFELLCFAGEHDRAEKHLDVLAGSGQDAEMGALFYRGVLNAERQRTEKFADEDYLPADSGPPPVRGTLNGEEFRSLEDADPRIGARFEVFAAGSYMWLPMQHVAALRVQGPQRLRDLIWAEARIQPGPELEALDLGEVILPVLSPLTARSEDPHVRLGRVTDWAETSDGLPYPVGQKLYLVDGEAVPILEVRELEIRGAAEESGSAG